MADHYPERLGAVFAFDPPMVFRVFWGAISPFINEVTKKKIHFLTGDKTKKHQLLLQFFEEEDLEVDFCGTSQDVFDHAVYWQRVLDHLETRQALAKARIENAKLHLETSAGEI